MKFAMRLVFLVTFCAVTFVNAADDRNPQTETAKSVSEMNLEEMVLYSGVSAEELAEMKADKASGFLKSAEREIRLMQIGLAFNQKEIHSIQFLLVAQSAGVTEGLAGEIEA